MKHSIRYFQFNYSSTGQHGISILIIRGMEIREYPYSSKNASRLNLSTMSWAHNGQWDTKYFPNKITFTRIYPQE